MQSLPKTSMAGTACLLFSSPLLFILLLGSSSTQGASLREHRLRGSEPDPRTGAPYQSPNADMLKALEYIENLRQRSGIYAQQQAPLTPESDANDMDAAEKLRTVLSLASPAQSQAQAGQDEKEEEEREEKEEDGEEDKTQEWLQAVLSTLQQTEESPKPSLARPNAASSKGQRSTATDSGHTWARQQHGTRSHRNHPLMFQEDEEGEGEGEEQEQGRASDHDSPFKRTNENVEEKYTPQNMATLQSVFEELGRLANAKAGHKRQIEEDENEDEDDDDDDGDGDGDDDNELLNLAYDVAGGDEWAPWEDEDEEAEERDRQESNRGLDYGNDEEGEDDDDDTYPVKRSSQSRPGDDPDDITKLVDYYLLKVLEKTKEEQKRELEEEEEEEEERAERRVAQLQYRDKIDPHAIYQLLQISQKLEIPPEDLLGLLTTEEMTKQDRTLLRSQAQPRRPNKLSGVKDKLSQKNMSPSAKLYNRRLPETHSSIPDDLNTEEILNILGLGSVGNHNSAPLKKQELHTSVQSRFHAAPVRHRGGYALSQTRVPDRLKDYDDGIDEDELAAYLAAQMLARYPQTVYDNKAGQKRASEPASREEDGQLGSFEQAIQDYLDQMDSVKSPPHKRQFEAGSMGGAPQTQSLDDTALLKILNYLKPENEESDEKDADTKTVEGM